MDKQQLAKEQPIAYRTLSHALKHDMLAHAYLFHGPQGTGKVACAELLAQSILCTNRAEDGFACGACQDCIRIKERTMTDFICLDGSSTSIKKENILKLQHEFSKTGLEHTGKKIYLIHHAENATVDALNSLLKFLEEPTAHLTAILICEQLDRLLPTIISRCQPIPFHPLSSEVCFQLCRDEIGELDAYLLSNMIHSPQELLQVAETEAYQHARYLFTGFLKHSLQSLHQAHSALLKEGFDNKKLDGKLCMRYFLDMLMTFYRDVIKQSNPLQDAWYTELYQQHLSLNIRYDAILAILLATKDKLWRSVNLTLLCDQMIFQMKEVMV